MKLSGSINNTGQILYKMMQGRIKRIMKRMMKRIIKAPVKKENSEKKNNTSEKKISAEQTDTEQKSDKTEQLPDVKTEKADKTEQIYQQEADERKAQKRVREAVQKENSEAAGKAHESYVIQPGDTLFQISMDRYGSIEAISQICKLNGMSADEIIYPGQVIVLP